MSTSRWAMSTHVSNASHLPSEKYGNFRSCDKLCSASKKDLVKTPRDSPELRVQKYNINSISPNLLVFCSISVN